ncbi:MAG: ComEC/Rec2 family competence protein, partial [bacterium]
MSDPGRRLVPAAATAWVACLAVLVPAGWLGSADARRSLATAGLVAAALLGLATAAVVAGMVLARADRGAAPTPGDGPAPGDAPAPPDAPSVRSARLAGTAVALGAAAAALASASLFLQGLAAAPLADVAERSGFAEVGVRVSGDIRLRTGAVRGPQRGEDSLEARALAQSLTVDGRSWLLSAPLLLRFPAGGLASPPGGLASPGTGAVVPGAEAVVRGVLRSAPPARGVAGILEVRSMDLVRPPEGLMAVAAAVRGGLRASLGDADPRAAALVAGLAVGDETGQSPELAEQMRASGLSHLTAVSGGNTAIVVGAVLLVTGILGLPLLARFALSLGALGFFVLIVGPQPSVLRAAAMGIVALIGLLHGSSRRGMAALAACTVVLLVLAPALSTAIGFALSVAATAGLIVLAPWLTRRWHGDTPQDGDNRLSRARARRALVQAAAITIAAQIATLPLIASFGDGISLVAVPANLLAAPAVAPVTVLGLLSALLSPVWPEGGRVLAGLAEPPAGWIALVAARSAAVPGATLPWPGGLAGAALACAVVAAAVVVVRRRRGRHERGHAWRTSLVATVGLAVVAIVALRVPERAGWPPEGWVAVACDVGQGDAFVVRASDGSALVVDAGPQPSTAARCLDDLGVRSVDLLVLTHAHADHVEGVPGILAGGAFGRVVSSPLREPAEQARGVEVWVAGVAARV